MYIVYIIYGEIWNLKILHDHLLECFKPFNFRVFGSPARNSSNNDGCCNDSTLVNTSLVTFLFVTK